MFPPVYFENKVVEQVSQVKFLGVYVDEYLNWKTHIEFVSTNLSKICGILYRVRHQLTQKALVNVYYTLLLSYHISFIYMGMFLALSSK